MDTPCDLIICLMYFMSLKIKVRKILKEDAIQRFVKHDYKVTSKANRMGIMLEGEKIKAFYEDMPPYQTVKKERYKLSVMAHLLSY